MPHISKKLLEKNKFLEIHNQLYKAVSNLVVSGKTRVVFNELLTKTEKIMLAKRLAVILMIDQGETTYAVRHTLKVSPSTVSRMYKLYEQGLFSELIKELKLQNNFWVQIKKIIPPRVGRDRFKTFLKF